MSGTRKPKETATTYRRDIANPSRRYVADDDMIGVARPAVRNDAIASAADPKRK
jgi:hypothetical protein